MRRPLLVLALFCAVVLGSILRASPAFACSCAPGPRSDDAAAQDYDVIFVGTATTVTDLGDAEDPNSDLRWTFDVDRVNQGEAARRQDVETNKGGGLCGYPFEEGQTYQVWAQERRGTLTTHLCSPTRDLADADPFEPASYPPGAQAPTTVAGHTELASTGVPVVPLAGGLILLVIGARARVWARNRAGS